MNIQQSFAIYLSCIQLLPRSFLDVRGAGGLELDGGGGGPLLDGGGGGGAPIGGGGGMPALLGGGGTEEVVAAGAAAGAAGEDGPLGRIQNNSIQKVLTLEKIRVLFFTKQI